MNISIFIENYVAGGSDKIARDLIDQLEYENLYLFVNRNNDCSILLNRSLPENCRLIKYRLITLHELGLFANSFKEKNIFLYWLLKSFNLLFRYPIMFFYFFYFYFQFRKYPIEVFFSNNGGYPGGECNRMATLAAAFLGIKNYHIVHNLATYPFFKPYKYIEDFIDWLLSKNTKFICVSNQAKDYLAKRRKIASDPVVIYNGVKKISENIKEIGNKNKTIKLLNIGALGERKNQILIIDALHLLQEKEVTNFELYIVGKEEDNGYVDKLKTKITDYGLDKKVFFEGFQSEIYRYYKDCDLFVLSSKVESFALVRVEAMSVGMPVITTDVGDAGYQVENSRNGYIVNSSYEMAIALEAYLIDCGLVREHAQQGFDIYNERFTIDKMVDEYRKLLVSGD